MTDSNSTPIRYRMTASTGHLIMGAYLLTLTVLVAFSYATLETAYYHPGFYRYLSAALALLLVLALLLIALLLGEIIVSRRCFELGDSEIRGYQSSLGIRHARWSLAAQGDLYVDCRQPSMTDMLQQEDERAPLLHLAPCLYAVYLIQRGKRERLFTSVDEQVALDFLARVQAAYPQLREVNRAGKPLEHAGERFPHRAEQLRHWLFHVKQAWVFATVISLAGGIACAVAAFLQHEDLDSPPREAQWRRTPATLRADHTRGRDEGYVVLHYSDTQSGRIRSSKRARLHELAECKDAEGRYWLYVNPEDGTQYSYSRESRADMEWRYHAYLTGAGLCLLLMGGSIVMFIRTPEYPD